MSKNNHKPKAKGSVGLKVLATTLVLSTIAGATAVCLTNENVRATLGIGSVPLQSEVPQNNNNQNTNSSELQVQIDKLIDEKAEDLASIKMLESEKASLQAELDEYKASLDSEKELTAEQSANISRLESAIADKDNQIAMLESSIAEKDAQITNLQSIINDLQNRVDVLENQIGAVSNSVLERVNTYEMKYDTNDIKNVFKKDNCVLLASNYSIELLDTNTNEYTVLNTSTSSTTHYIYGIDNEVFVWGKGFYKVDFENKQLIQINDGYNGAYTCPTGELLRTIKYDDGRILIESSSSITIIHTDNTIETYYKYKTKNIGNEVYYVLPKTAGTSTGRCIKKLDKDGNFEEVYSFTETTIFDIYDINMYNNILFIQYNYQRSNSTSYATMKSVDMNTGEENIILSSSQPASFQYTIKDFGEKLMFYYNQYCYLYNFNDGSWTTVSLLSGAGNSLVEVDGYIFTISLSAVFNPDTGLFQATTTASSGVVTPIIVGEFIYRNMGSTLQYFDKDTLTFIELGYESSDYSGCNGLLQVVNGKIFCSLSGSTSNALKSGIFYIDTETQTIRKVADSGNGEMLNDKGTNYSKSTAVGDSHALLCGTGYSILVNTDTMTTIEVYADISSSSNVFVEDNFIILTYGNYIWTLNKSTFELRTKYSIESVSGLNKIYKIGSKVYFASDSASTTVCFDMDNESITNYYGPGALVDINGLKLGYHTASATLFDPLTGDIMNIKSYNSTVSPTMKETKDSTMFIIKNIVYEVMK